jgi:hypothetical protein
MFVCCCVAIVAMFCCCVAVVAMSCCCVAVVAMFSCCVAVVAMFCCCVAVVAMFCCCVAIVAMLYHVLWRLWPCFVVVWRLWPCFVVVWRLWPCFAVVWRLWPCCVAIVAIPHVTRVGGWDQKHTTATRHKGRAVATQTDASHVRACRYGADEATIREDRERKAGRATAQVRGSVAAPLVRSVVLRPLRGLRTHRFTFCGAARSTSR